jgi:hypothetical protein
MAKCPCHMGRAGRMELAALMSRPSGPVVRNWGSVGSDSTMKTLRAPRFALFHTMGDMMTVILRMEGRSGSNSLPQA